MGPQGIKGKGVVLFESHQLCSRLNSFLFLNRIVYSLLTIFIISPSYALSYLFQGILVRMEIPK